MWKNVRLDTHQIASQGCVTDLQTDLQTNLQADLQADLQTDLQADLHHACQLECLYLRACYCSRLTAKDLSIGPSLTTLIKDDA